MLSKIGFLVCVGFVPMLIGQTSGIGAFRPDRGFMPYGSYSVSGLDSINESTGGLFFRLPLASLPPGRGGFSMGVGLAYNSQIYETRHQPASTANYQGCAQDCTGVYVDAIEASDLGGWKYEFNYALRSEALEGGCLAHTSLVLPDGSTHVLRLAGGTSDQTHDAYYQYDVRGYKACSTMTGGPIGPHLTYYTTDGSFIQVTVDDLPGTSNPDDRTWTAVFPDGKRVTGTVWSATPALQPVTVCDRNANCVVIQNFASVGTTTPIINTQITDAQGRSVRITYEVTCGTPPCVVTEDEVTLPGYQADMTATPDQQHATGALKLLKWTVKWDHISSALSAENVAYPCNAPSSCIFLGGSHRSVTEVKLPTGLSYYFSYAGESAPAGEKGLGELRQVLLPNVALSTTPRIEYKWKYSEGTPGLSNINYFQYGRTNPIASKTLYYKDPLLSSGSAAISQQWIYETDNTDHTVTKITGPEGEQRNSFVRENCSGCGSQKYKTILPSGATVEQYWKENIPWVGTAGQSSQKNRYLRAEYRTESGFSTATATKFDYDKNGNLTVKSEYGWGSVPRGTNGVPNGDPSGTALRVTVNVYPVSPGLADDPMPMTFGGTDANAYWRNFNLPANGAVKRSEVGGPNASGSFETKAVTEYTYDSAYNVTKELHWDDQGLGGTPPSSLTASNSIQTSRNWSYGNLLDETDPDGDVTKYEYAALSVGNTSCPTGAGYTNLYPTKVTRAFGLTEKRETELTYDCATGLVMSSRDVQNDLITTVDYDPFGRQKEVNEFGARKSKTAFNDSARTVTVSSDVETFGDFSSKTVYSFSELGSLYQAVTTTNDTNASNSSADVTVLSGDRVVNGLRYSLSSNPYVSTSDETMGWGLKTFDSDGKLLRDEMFKGATMPAPWGSNASSLGATQYLYFKDHTGVANVTKSSVSDAAGHWTDSTVDALGRLVAVDQNGLSSASYEYDALGSLTKVSQADNVNYSSATQVRNFTYSSLGRLVSAFNPESGTMDYEYFPGGALKKRTDDRDATMTIPFMDGLKRPALKVYGGIAAASPTVYYCYDGKIYVGGRCVTGTRGAGDKPIGHLTGYGSSVDNGDAAQNYLTIDGLGRVLRSEQRVGSVAYQFDYTYAANGFQKSVTYPSMKRVDYTQSLRGLPLSAVVGTNAYASGVVYNAAGAMREMVGGGNAFKQTWGYNAKGQMLNMEANAGATLSTLRLRLDLGYGADDANTGNLMDQKITAGADVYPQYFRYDAANRLALFVENPNPSTPPANHTDPCVSYGASTRCQRYGFDRFGNIWQAERQGPGVDMLASGATSYSGSTNRIAGAQYDAAGNMEQYGAGITTQLAVYDSEGRIAKINGAGTAIDYYYDGEGLRIKKKVGGVTTVFVYDATKQLMAEYETGGAPVSGVNYLVTDHLGSTRMLLDGVGGVVERFDFVPFGGELVRSGNGYGVAGDPVKQKFGGKERDGESGLDYFGARYLSGAMGRFTSPDAPFADQGPADPQSWNLYRYVRNNPLKYVDPSGRSADVTIETDEEAKKGKITVNATLVVYAETTSGLTGDQVRAAAATIQSRINQAWSGGFKQNGITYTVTTSVTVQVASSEKAALASGAGNIISLSNGNASATADSQVFPRDTLLSTIFPGSDRGEWNVKNLSKTAAHEWGHLLGVGDYTSGNMLMNTKLLRNPKNSLSATSVDFGSAFGGLSEAHRFRSIPVFPMVSSGPNSARSTTTVRTPGLFGGWRF